MSKQCDRKQVVKLRIYWEGIAGSSMLYRGIQEVEYCGDCYPELTNGFVALLLAAKLRSEILIEVIDENCEPISLFATALESFRVTEYVNITKEAH